ncbi:MAG TPA: sulfurtransferase TusA family protein [Coleofasciculaceae cyanobacterium]|jgi:TusA-related sulfurtransferase
MTPPSSKQTLDLRTTKCPLNFVKTRLALEKLSVGDILEVWILIESQSALNIPKSIQQEGHEILSTETEADGLQRIFIRKSS